MQTKAKIYKPARNAMQSGKAKTKRWKLEFKRNTSMSPDPLMGWNTMHDTNQEIHLHFGTREEAVAYAEAKQIPYEIWEPKAERIPPKAYAENFTFARRTAFDPKAQS